MSGVHKKIEQLNAEVAGSNYSIECIADFYNGTNLTCLVIKLDDNLKTELKIWVDIGAAGLPRLQFDVAQLKNIPQMTTILTTEK